MVDRVAGLGQRSTLLGRSDECALLDGLLADVRGGESRSLVVRGEAGVGKTALLDYLVDSASDLRVFGAAGVESEMELAYASLHQLCARLIDRLGGLPDPQHEALEVVFGLSAGAAPDRFLVGLGVLSLFADAAEERPLLFVVDDAQWLDQASALTLAFVARRLLVERVGMIFSARAPGDELRGLPELEVEGLREADARELLASTARWPLDVAVLDQVVAETRGNPLALLELPRGVSPTDLAGGFALPGAAPLSGRIEESFLHRVRELPVEAQQLLLVAAAEPLGDPALLWGAAQNLGLDGAAIDAAERAGLLEAKDRVRFRHPLVRSAIYRGASVEERRRAHRALAEATDAAIDADRRAWHLAEATAGLDDEVAVELEQAAARAQARGGLAAAAAFLRRSFALTSDLEHGTERALAAAAADIDVGGLETAGRLLGAVESRRLTVLQRGRVDLLRGRIAASARRNRDASPLLLSAASRVKAVDHGLAVRTYYEAFYAAIGAGRFAAEGSSVGDVARAMRRFLGRSRADPTEMLLAGLADLVIDGYAAGAPVIRRALGELRDRDIAPAYQLLWLPLAGRMAHDTWDMETWNILGTRLVGRARQIGALVPLRLGLLQTVVPALCAGRLPVAAAAAEEVEAINAAIESPISPTGAVVVAAWQGRVDEVDRLIAAASHDAATRGNGAWFSAAGWASAVLHNGLGRYEEALAAALDGSVFPDELGMANWSLVELVEAAARAGVPKRAAGAMDRVVEMADACRTDWILGIEARSRALLAEGETADSLYRSAIGHLDSAQVRAWLARTQLIYGEYLRRENRRVDARAQLRAAHEVFVTAGMVGFAQRAERELRATGEHVRAHALEARDDLTAQERQIAELARDGLTNPEIGARLFLSPRTVEWHLRHVFGKLGIRSRRELAKALPVNRSQTVAA